MFEQRVDQFSTFWSCPRCWLYKVSSSPLKYCRALTHCSTLEWYCSMVLCSRWWMSRSCWTDGRSVPKSAFFSCFYTRKNTLPADFGDFCRQLTNLFLHHSMCSCKDLKWGLVSMFLVSCTVLICFVTVRSSTGKLMLAKGPTILLCNWCLRRTHFSCSLFTRLSSSPAYKINWVG